MDAQEVEAAAQIEPIQTGMPEICAVEVEEAHAYRKDTREAEAHETADAEAKQAHGPDEPAGDAAEARVVEASTAEASAVEAGAGEVEPLETQVNESVIEEEETQLAAIRELMTRASARGLWLTLSEIAEATEFAEASISAQLRHLRKPRHGGHRVEKRHRGRGRSFAARTIRDRRRGPVIWEYRMLPRAERLF